MKTARKGKKYVLRLEKGEEVVEKVENFCTDRQISAGQLEGLGALSEATLGHYSLKTKEYTERTFSEPLEIVSLLGVITQEGIHPHICVADEGFRTYGGHLAKGVVAATCEITITPFEGPLTRYHDSEIGLDLLDI